MVTIFRTYDDPQKIYHAQCILFYSVVIHIICAQYILILSMQYVIYKRSSSVSRPMILPAGIKGSKATAIKHRQIRRNSDV